MSDDDAAAEVIRSATPVKDSEFDPFDLDLAAATTDTLTRAEADRTVIWASPDGEVAYKATLPETCRECGESRRIEGSFYCPDCHPEVDADADDPPLVADQADELDDGIEETDEKGDESGEGGVEMKGPATAIAESPESPADITKAGTNEIDVEALPEEHQRALEADDFYIYGKASIEQWDDDDVPTKIEMDALEDALDRFFESEAAPGIISRYHQDIPVGRPVREVELKEDVTIQLASPEGDPETYEFGAGDTLRTHVEDGDDDGKPELWLASNLANDTEPAKRARLLALQGDLDGYSVTIHRNDDELTQEGRKVTKCDLHAVTLGTGEQIKNSGSTFDVAEFKATVRNGVGLTEEKAQKLAGAIVSVFD